MLEQSQASNCPETAQKRFLFRSPEDNVLSLVSPTPNYSNIPSDSTHCVAPRKGGVEICPVFFAETAAASELVAPAEPIAAVHAADDMDADAAMQVGQTVRGQGRAVGGGLGGMASHSVGLN